MFFKKKYIKITSLTLILFNSQYSMGNESNQEELKAKITELVTEFIDNKTALIKRIDTKEIINVLPFNLKKNVGKCKNEIIIKNADNFKITNFNNIEIMCIEDNKLIWKTSVKAEYKELYPIIYANKNIQNGSVIKKSDLTLEYTQQSRLQKRGYSKFEQVVNSTAIKSIYSGRVIKKNSTCLICKGDSVKMKIESESFSLITNGTALQNGNKGDKIALINKTNGKKIKGKVLTKKTIIIGD